MFLNVLLNILINLNIEFKHSYVLYFIFFVDILLLSNYYQIIV